MNGFDKELYIATVATATIIMNYANDVAIVWDRLLQDYRSKLLGYLQGLEVSYLVICSDLH